MAKSEYEGICYTSGMTKEGWQVSVTERAESSLEAYQNLLGTIANMVEDGVKPFVNAYNRAELQSDVQTYTDAPVSTTLVEAAQALGGVVNEGVTVDGYLGIKPEKLENIAEGQTYDVVAQKYSYDGTWVNFFGSSSNLSLAGHYYNTKVGTKIFNELFHWAPAFVEKAPIPGGDVIITVVGNKDKNSDKIYQNIKSVTLA